MGYQLLIGRLFRPQIGEKFMESELNHVKVEVVILNDSPILRVVLLVRLKFCYPLFHKFELILRFHELRRRCVFGWRYCIAFLLQIENLSV